MRSVHTPASVHPHWEGTSLPCLARGTPGRLNCVCVSLTPPLSYPPSLHGHYPLRCYYGDSDSCPAPCGTSTGILDSRTCTSRHSASNHPMRPCLPAMLSAPGRLGPRFAWFRYRRFFGLRSVVAVSSVASGRIRVRVAARYWATVLRTVRSLPVALHPVSPRRSYFQLMAGSSATEGLPPSCVCSLSSARPWTLCVLWPLLRSLQYEHRISHP